MEIFGVPFPFLKTRYLLGGPEIGRVFVSALGGFTTARKEEESWTDEVFFVFQDNGNPICAEWGDCIFTYMNG